MAKFYPQLTTELKNFISQQKLFFVGTAAPSGSVNVSPKGLDSLRILSDSKIVWINLTGSGNETAAHLLKLNRMTLMFNSFEAKPLILRLYGKARAYHSRDEEFQEYIKLFAEPLGIRQVIEMDIERVQTSCGFAVPQMEFKADRELLHKWNQTKGPDKIRDYWEEKNQVSIDGFDTGIME